MTIDPLISRLLCDAAERDEKERENELRDKFAISAMCALMPIYWEHVGDYKDGLSLVKCHAETAYEYADAMLRARSQGEQE